MAKNPITGKLLYYAPKPTIFDKGIGAALPQAYRKFYAEWMEKQPTPVHYIEKPGRYKRNEKTGEVFPVQNVPLQLRYPPEIHKGIWGGEAVVQGFVKRNHQNNRRVSRWWIPALKKATLYSEVLDRYMYTTVTLRTMNLIHESYGLDHYLLKTPACDLYSLLALKLKKQILQALDEKTLYPEDPEKREQVYNRYKEYLQAYTKEDIEWYGLDFKEACGKMEKILAEQNKPQPLKLALRQKLLEELRKLEVEHEKEEEEKKKLAESASWMSKLNPFSSSTPKTQ